MFVIKVDVDIIIIMIKVKSMLVSIYNFRQISSIQTHENFFIAFSVVFTVLMAIGNFLIVRNSDQYVVATFPIVATFILTFFQY